MQPFQEQPRNSGQPDGLRFTSRHTADFGDKTYDVRKIIELAEALPETVIPIERLAKMKGGKYWHDAQGQWIGPQDILELYTQESGDWDAMVASRPEFADHIRAVQNADYESRPLILIGPENEEWVIDGMHRLTKAWIDKVTEIKTKRFENLPDEAIIAST